MSRQSILADRVKTRDHEPGKITLNEETAEGSAVNPHGCRHHQEETCRFGLSVADSTGGEYPGVGLVIHVLPCAVAARASARDLSLIYRVSLICYRNLPLDCATVLKSIRAAVRYRTRKLIRRASGEAIRLLRRYPFPGVKGATRSVGPRARAATFILRGLSGFRHRIAGLGNIYACEALFRAHLHPARHCHTLTRREAAALARAVRAILRSAIEHRGTTFSDFMDSDGEYGEHQDFLRVFQREGEKCRRCRATIRRMRQANRSTYFCPYCQNGRLSGKGKKG